VNATAYCAQKLRLTMARRN